MIDSDTTINEHSEPQAAESSPGPAPSSEEAPALIEHEKLSGDEAMKRERPFTYRDLSGAIITLS